MPHPSPARWLAPIALVAAAVAVLLVLAGSGGSSDEAASEPAAPTSTGRTSTTVAQGQEQGDAASRTYKVKSGDSLTSIADRTGVAVERLQQLNPDVDAQTLRVGQTLKLRE
ncbi:LysM domain-containing protein [Conexibacter sp. SYSU D00693]|uniref:LysM peptidoglycan-binding domain-containing protein n=1 Tax=Conexibacter sp. SYSU D00693 TaxID=2812560 RepID=UPI00196ACEE1|nr:LysM domain-containing protein [Conexibacter sp. SYSU D00693]